MPIRLALKVDVDTDRGTRHRRAEPGGRLPRIRRARVLPVLARARPDRPGDHADLPPGFFQEGQPHERRPAVRPPHAAQRHAPARPTHRPAQRRGDARGARRRVRGRHPLLQPLSLAGPRAPHEPRRSAGGIRRGARRVPAHLRRARRTPPARAGWQSNARSREVYDEAGLLYASDTRNGPPFFPRIDGRVFRTLEIPSTLPTFDELLGRPEFPDDRIVPHYLVAPARRTGPTCSRSTPRSRAWANARSSATCSRACRNRGVEFIRLDEPRARAACRTARSFPCATRSWRPSTAAPAWSPRSPAGSLSGFALPAPKQTADAVWIARPSII